MSIFSSLFGGLRSEPIAVGADAPDLEVTIDSGETLNLADIYTRGPTLVYFYPKADTPGCTAQACNLRDHFEELISAGINVVGISTDTVEKLQKFKAKYNLPFTLVADKAGDVGKAFSTDKFAGLLYARQSFLVMDHKIAWRDLKATPAEQAQAVLAAVQENDTAKDCE